MDGALLFCYLFCRCVCRYDCNSGMELHPSIFCLSLSHSAKMPTHNTTTTSKANPPVYEVA